MNFQQRLDRYLTQSDEHLLPHDVSFEHLRVCIECQDKYHLLLNHHGLSEEQWAASEIKTEAFNDPSSSNYQD
jgi:hypothetical protein